MDFEPKIIAKILNAPAYQEKCDILYHLFVLSREAGSDASKLLHVQEGLCGCMLAFQEAKADFKKQGDELRFAIASRLILLAKQIGDSIAWRMLNFDRVLIQQLSEHNKTGDIDKTTLGDLNLARHIAETEGSIVLVNDLTNVLRHGDLTIIKGHGQDTQIEFEIFESKWGKTSAKDKRAKRQRKRLEELFDFIDNGVRLRDNEEVIVYRMPFSPNTYHNSLAKAVNEAKNSGVYNGLLSDVLSVYIVPPSNQTELAVGMQRFWNTEYLLTLNNVDLFSQPKLGVMPYGNFPLADEDCFNLMSGYMFLSATLNFEVLKHKYFTSGLSLSLPNPTPSDIQNYLNASIKDRKSMMYEQMFTVGRGKSQYKLSNDNYARIVLEFIHEDTIINTHNHLLTMTEGFQFTENVKTLFYIGYTGEQEIWR